MDLYFPVRYVYVYNNISQNYFCGGKYLLLNLFSVVNSVKDKNAFGDTAKLFEDIDEEEDK